MARCRLSQLMRVTALRMERTNDRLDAAVRSSEKLREELQARAIARDAETAAAYARLARFNQIENATYEDITAYLDEANAHTRQSAIARSVALSSTSDFSTVKAYRSHP